MGTTDHDADAGAVGSDLVERLLAYPGDETLEHHGVKGMKWGVRKDKGHEGERVKTKKLGKLDRKWEGQNTGMHGFIKAHNAMANRLNNGEIDKFNNEPRWKKAADDGVLHDDKHPETVAYWDAVDKMTNRVMAEEMVKVGMNPSGTKQFELREDADGNAYAYLAPVKKQAAAQHADGDTETVYKLNKTAAGTLESLEETELTLKHDAVNDFLAHYGVKGMRWGVRKDKDTPGPRPVTATQKKPGKFVTTKGGEKHPAHEDAVKAAVARQKAKASTTDALSNKELQDAVTRMNLEAQYKKLEFETDRRSKGARFIAGLLGNPRYNGQKRTFTDPQESTGTAIRDAVAEALAEKKAAA